MMTQSTSKAYGLSMPTYSLRWLFLIVLTLFVNVVAFGQTNIFTYSNSTATIPTGFVLTNNVATNPLIDQSTYLLLDAGAPSDLIVTPNYNLSTYTTATINVNVATFGSGTAYPMKIEFSTDGGTTWNATTYTTATPSSSTYITGGPIVITQSFTSTTKFRFSNNGTSGRGVRIQNLVLDASGTAGITSAQSGNWSSTSTWVGGVVPSASSNVIIASGHTVTADVAVTRNAGTTTTVTGTLATNLTYSNNGTTTVNGTFQINQGGFGGGTGTYTYGAASTLIYNHTSGTYGPIDSGHVYWPSTNGPVNVTIANSGSGGINLSVARTVTGVFQTAAGVTLSGGIALTLNGTCRINTGGFFNNAPTYGSSSTLVYNTGSAFGRSTEWSATSGPGYPANVQISNPGTVTTLNMLTTAAQCSGTLTVDASTVINTTSGGLTVLGNVLVNGTISLGGDVTTNGNWTLGAAATQTNNSKAVFFTAATGNQVITRTGAGSIAFDYLIVNKAAGNVQLSASPATSISIASTAGDVIQLLNAGALDLNGQSLTLSGTNGNIGVNASGRSITSTATGATLTITGNKFVTGAGTLSIGANVTTILTAGLDFGSAKTTINGTLQINNGGFANNNAPIYAATSTLIYNGVTGYGVGNEWTGNATTAGTGNPQNVTLTTSSVNMPASATRALAGNLNVGTGSTLNLGTLVGGDLTIGGNLTNSGTFNANTRLVTFGGTTAQTLTGATTFDYLKVNNSAGLTINNAVVVTTNLDLTSGKLTLGANNLTLNAAASISNATATNYIVTNSTGRVVKAAVAAVAFTFPIGLNTTNYTPVTVTNTTGTSDLSVNVGSTITNAVTDATKIVNLQWSVTSSAATTATITPTWVAANQAASFTNTGAGEVGNYTTLYTVYPVTLSTTTTTATGVSLQNGTNLIVVGNTNAIAAPAPANDLCTNATTLTIGAAAVSGTLAASTVTSGNTFTYASTKRDVWYKFTPNCTGSHTVTLTFTSGPDIDIDLFTATCPTTGTATAVSHGTTTTETITASLTAGTTYYIRVIDFNTNATSFNINVTSAVTPTFTLANTGTPAAGNVVAGASNAVLFGFALTPNACSNSFDFTAANITLGGTATTTEYSNFRIIVDTNANGLADAGEVASPIGTVATYAATLAFTVTGQTGLTAVTRYLLIADASPTATIGATISASLTAANTTASVTVSGTATGNTMTLLGTPPALVAASGATVDNPFVITFVDNPTWRAAITSVTVGGTTLTAGYTVSAGQITFTPSASVPAALLQSSGTKTIAVNATNYGATSVSQAIGYGVATKLGITTQPTAPTSNGGTLAAQPVLAIQDQYGNTVANATNSVTAAVGAGAYTLGGTLTLNAVAGVVTYSGLTASSSALVTGATIAFTSSGLTSVNSNTFTVPAPDYIILNTVGVAVTEDMTIGTSATASFPQGFKVSTAVGSPSAPLWIDATNNITATTNRGGTLAAASSGGTYNWANGDPTSSTDRAIGFLTSGSYPTGTTANNVGLSILSKVRNNTASTLNDITVSFDYEKYRTGSNVCTMTFFYSTNGTSWTAATTGNHTFAADANSASVPAGAPVTVSKSVVLSGINLPAGSDIYFRWSYASGGSNAQGIGLDNFSIYGCRTLTASIQSNNSPICEGSSATFNVTGTSGTTLNYTINGGATQNVVLTGGSATITINGATTNQSLNLVSVSEGLCSTSVSGTSTVTVNPSLPASVAIAASSASICPGDAVTFTATPTNGGTLPTYQWKVNGTDVPGEVLSTFTTSTLVNGDQVTVVMTSNATPCLTNSPATSNTITITVNPTLTASVVISTASTTVCTGSAVTFTATPTNGGTTPTYQWKVNGFDVVGETNATFTTSTLMDADVVTVVMTSNATPCLAGSPALSNALTITVTPSTVASVAIVSTATTICFGTSVTFTATPTNGGTTPSYQWKVNGNNVGTDSPIYTTTALAHNDVVTVVMTSNATPCLVGSPATSNAITITVNALGSATISGTNGPALCPGSDVTFTVTGTADAIVYYNLNGGSTAFTVLTGGSATITVAGATSTQTLNLVSVDNGLCPVTLSETATVTLETTTWNGTTWSHGAPTATVAAVIAGNMTITSNIEACSLTVNNNAAVSVASGYNVTLQNALTVASGSSFTVNSNANLIQVNPAAVNSGAIVVKRTTNPLMRLDYVLWGSPVAGQNLFNFSPLTSVSPSIRFYTYTTAINFYNGVTDYATHTMQTGKGYLIRLPFNHPTAPATWTGSFTGVPNNGTQTVTLANNGAGFRYNAVSNPYPSTLDMAQFYADNSNAIEPTLYFWRKTNSSANPSYCSYNLFTNSYVDNNQAYTENPNGVIQVGQGFFVEAKDSSTSVEFNNTQRIGNNANQMFRTAGVTTQSIERNRIWLNLTGTAGEFSQTMVGYFTGGTLAADVTDAKFFNDGTTALHTKINGEAYSMNGRPVPFDATDIVPLTYKVATAGTFSITIGQKDGLFADTALNQIIYLKDNETNTYHNLNDGAYSFSTQAGTFDSRFELVYQNALSNENPTLDASAFAVVKSNGKVRVQATTNLETVRIYDLHGRLLTQVTHVNAQEVTLPVQVADQVLMVQVLTADQRMGVKKAL